MSDNKKLEADEEFFPRPARLKAAELPPSLPAEESDELMDSIGADELLIPRALPAPDKKLLRDMSKSPILARAWSRIEKSFADRPYEQTPDPYLRNSLKDAQVAAGRWMVEKEITTDNMNLESFQHRLFPMAKEDENADALDTEYTESAETPAIPPAPAPQLAPAGTSAPEKAKETVYLATRSVGDSGAFDLELAWRVEPDPEGNRPRSAIHDRVARLDPADPGLVERLREARALINGRPCMAWAAPEIFLAFSNALAQAPEAAKEFEPLYQWMKLNSVRSQASVVYRLHSAEEMDRVSVATFARRFHIQETSHLYKAARAVHLMQIRGRIASELAERESGRDIKPLELDPPEAWEEENE